MKPTTDEVLAWAREADLPACHTTHPKALIRFAALAYAAGAAAMKERAAKVCDEEKAEWLELADGLLPAAEDRAEAVSFCAEAIRALGDDDE